MLDEFYDSKLVKFIGTKSCQLSFLGLDKSVKVHRREIYFIYLFKKRGTCKSQCYFGMGGNTLLYTLEAPWLPFVKNRAAIHAVIVYLLKEV